MEEKDGKKQIPLRLSKRLCDELTKWAEDDFRSLNGQIEYLLTEAVIKRKKRVKLEDFPFDVSKKENHNENE